MYVKKKGLKYTNKKSEVIYSSQEDFYPGGEEHPSTSVLGDIVKKGKMIIVTNNIGNVFPIGLTLQRPMPQKNELLI